LKITDIRYIVAVATTPKGRLPPASLWNPSELLIKCDPPLKAISST